MFATASAFSTQPLQHPDPMYGQRRKSRGRSPSVKRLYEKRKMEGRCAYFGCRNQPEAGRVSCLKHLESAAREVKRIKDERKRQGLCANCGKRPGFWGIDCILCRQLKTKHPLPYGARRALRMYREAEKKFEAECREAKARCAVRKLLARGDITGPRARALELYAGLDHGAWRTYAHVGKLMKISRERVRQLLYPSKVILTEMLNGDVPWSPFTTRQPASPQE